MSDSENNSKGEPTKKTSEAHFIKGGDSILFNSKIDTPLSDGIRKAMGKTTSLSSAFRNMDAISTAMAKHNEVFDALKGLSKFQFMTDYSKFTSHTKDAFELSHSLSKVFQPTNEVSQLMKTVSSIQNISKILQPAKELSLFVKAVAFQNQIQDSVLSNMSLFNTHLDISKSITAQFMIKEQVNLGQDISKLFNNDNFLHAKKLNSFDILSGTAFSFISKMQKQDNVDTEETYRSIEEILKENSDLKDEIIKLQSTIIKSYSNQNSQSRIETDSEVELRLIGLTTILEWFLNKILIKRFNINPKVAITLTYILYFTAEVGKEAIVEAKAAKLYYKVMGQEAEKNTPTKSTYNFYYTNKDIIDFTIKKVKLFARPSIKTDVVGIISNNTDVVILKIVEGWCLIEGNGVIEKTNIRKNRKKYNVKNGKILVSQKIKGWVKKNNLDMFQ
jgi:hypothetical protein